MSLCPVFPGECDDCEQCARIGFCECHDCYVCGDVDCEGHR